MHGTLRIGRNLTGWGYFYGPKACTISQIHGRDSIGLTTRPAGSGGRDRRPGVADGLGSTRQWLCLGITGSTRLLVVSSDEATSGNGALLRALAKVGPMSRVDPDACKGTGSTRLRVVQVAQRPRQGTGEEKARKRVPPGRS